MPPPIAIRWLRPTTSTPHLQLPTAPISVSNVDTWIALSAQESARCEEAWQALSEEQRLAAEVSAEGNGSEPVEDADDETVGISISEDRLFEVDVRTMEAGSLLEIYVAYAESLYSMP
jgi:hypothetical protein